MTADAEQTIADALTLTCKSCGFQWSVSLPRGPLEAWTAAVESPCPECREPYRLTSGDAP